MNEIPPEDPFRADYLRPPKFVIEPDPRNGSRKNRESLPDLFRPRQLDDYYAAVSAFQLVEGVPEDVIVHFETAKNLYLYAYFVYRF